MLIMVVSDQKRITKISNVPLQANRQKSLNSTKVLSFRFFQLQCNSKTREQIH